jgi:hypothetical protein
LFEDINHRLLSGLIYKAATRGDHGCPSYTFVWKNFAPPRVKFFGWLLTQVRIQCRAALACKHILEDATCEICKAAEETADHIFSAWTFAHSFWASIGWNPAGVAKVTEIWNTQTPPRIAKNVRHPLLLFLCWEVWKHRNDVVFRGLPPSIARLTSACKESIHAWSCRIPRKDEALAMNWRQALSM